MRHTPKHPCPTTLGLGHPQLVYDRDKVSATYLINSRSIHFRWEQQNELKINFIIAIWSCQLCRFGQVLQIISPNLKHYRMLLRAICQESILVHLKNHINVRSRWLIDTEALVSDKLLLKVQAASVITYQYKKILLEINLGYRNISSRCPYFPRILHQ